jgi:hypothetical protein
LGEGLERVSHEDEAQELAEHVQSALADAVHDLDGSMLTRYVACVEVIDPSGERALWVLSTRDMKAWETVGFLEYARDLERGEPEP